MTREEIIEGLELLENRSKRNKDSYTAEVAKEAIKMLNNQSLEYVKKDK